MHAATAARAALPRVLLARATPKVSRAGEVDRVDRDGNSRTSEPRVPTPNRPARLSAFGSSGRCADIAPGPNRTLSGREPDRLRAPEWNASDRKKPRLWGLGLGVDADENNTVNGEHCSNYAP